MEERAVILESGLRAVIRPDAFIPGSFELVVDGTPQSHVNAQDPRDLFFEYVRRMGHVIDVVRPPGAPITAVHLGAGALTLPRYIEASRPGSRQQVIELERKLVDLVRQVLPLPRGAAIRIRYGDARDVLRALPAGLRGKADVVIVDIFAGPRIPAHVTSLEFYRECGALLRSDGVLLVNAADGAGAAFARGQAATLATAFHDVALIAEPHVLRGRRFGNFVFLASPSPLPTDWLPRLLAGGPHPATLVHGRELRDWTGGAPVVTDATAAPSPAPGRGVFLSRGGST